jgi:hypothetical protein
MDEDFATLVRARLVDTDWVREALGYRNRQSVHDLVARGTLAPPIIKTARGYALWDRLDVDEALTRRSAA